MQLGRSLFMLWAVRHHDPANFRNFQRIVAWLSVSGAFWIAGALSGEETRFTVWAVALLIDYTGPAVGFRTPGLGRSTTADWEIEGGHLAERCALFIIIALGESVLVIGATFAGMEWTPQAFATFVASFLATVAMWGLYFNIGQEYGHRRIVEASDTGRIARFAYTYIHILLVAGIIVTAVADELVLAHPVGEMDFKTVLVVLGGPAIYLTGNLLFKTAIFDRAPLSHFGGLALLAVLIPVSGKLVPLALAIATTGILTLVVLWEYVSLRRVRERLAQDAQASGDVEITNR
jgi:low temperature requirement protein LtrA